MKILHRSGEAGVRARNARYRYDIHLRSTGPSPLAVLGLHQKEKQMRSHESPITRMIMIRVDPREDLLDALQRAVAEHSVENGIFVSGAGSLSRYHFHVVSSTNLPPENVFVEGEGAYDIVAITGAVLGGRVHAHITFTDDTSTLGGHMEPGCEVLTFAMVALAETPAQDLSQWDHVAR